MLFALVLLIPLALACNHAYHPRVDFLSMDYTKYESLYKHQFINLQNGTELVFETPRKVNCIDFYQSLTCTKIQANSDVSYCGAIKFEKNSELKNIIDEEYIFSSGNTREEKIQANYENFVTKFFENMQVDMLIDSLTSTHGTTRTNNYWCCATSYILGHDDMSFSFCAREMEPLTRNVPFEKPVIKCPTTVFSSLCNEHPGNCHFQDGACRTITKTNVMQTYGE